MAVSTITILSVIGIILLWIVVAYNGLIFWRNQVKNSWSQIDVQLKRRYDLIPNLVETVRGYAKHVKEKAGWFDTHPPISERIRILREMAHAASS